MTAAQAPRLSWRIVPLRRVVAWAVVVAGVAYSSWVLEYFLHTGLDPRTTFLSELDAAGQRFRDVFSIADTITGLLAVVAGVTALLGLPRRRLTTVGWCAFVVFGVATIADAHLPIGCVPTPSHPCSSEPSGLFPQLHHIHALTSTVAVNAIFVAMIAFTWAAFRYAKPSGRVLGTALFALVCAATAWLMIADNLPGEYYLGIAQRVQVGGISAWLIVLGATVLSESR